MAIRGVVFDFGGVISKPPREAFFATITNLTDWSKDELLAGWKRYRRAMDADEIPVEEVYARIAQERGQVLSAETLARIRALDYDAWVTPNKETLAWAKKLKNDLGFKIGILTNMPTDFIPWFERCAGAFRRLADAEVISGPEHLAKPQEEIYRLMEARMRLPPEELFFFDDTQANVDAAIAYGWKASRFINVSQARKDLADVRLSEFVKAYKKENAKNSLTSAIEL